MNISDFKTFLKNLKKVSNHTVYLQGPPGSGKSSAIAQVVEEEGFNFFADLRLGMMDAVEVRGVQIPVAEEAITIETLPSYFPKDDDAKGFILLDEFDHAAPSVQSAAYQLILDRKIGKFSLPDGVTVLMASNSKADGGVHYRVPRPIKNRVIQVQVSATSDEWLEHAKEKEINPLIISFIKNNPNFLYHEKESDENHSRRDAKSLGAFATPRSWFMVNSLLELDMDDYTLREIMIGTIGYDATMHFLDYIKNVETSLDINVILKGDLSSISPEDLENREALTHTLVVLESVLNKQKNNKFEHNLLDFIVNYIPEKYSSLKVTYYRTLTTKAPKIFTPTIKDKEGKALRDQAIQLIQNVTAEVVNI